MHRRGRLQSLLCASRWQRRTPRNKGTSKAPARRYSAIWCGPCAPSRIGRLQIQPAGSSPVTHQPNEYVLKRALRGLQVPEADSRTVEIGQESGNSRALDLTVI